MDKLKLMGLYCKKFYFAVYRPIMDIIDKFVSVFILYILDYIHIASLTTRGQLEDYILRKGYSSLKQFERTLSPRAEVYLTMIIDHRMTWTEINEKILEISDGVVNLPKRQCYKLKAGALAEYGNIKKNNPKNDRVISA